LRQKAEYLYGLATAIGSVPHQEAEEALRLVKENLVYGPHWPQLPARGKVESFVRQYLHPLVKLGMVETEQGETPFFCDQGGSWLEKSEQFYSYYLDAAGEGSQKEQALSFFAFPEDAAKGFYRFLEEDWKGGDRRPVFLKGQISGPLSMGLQVNAEEGGAAFYQEGLRDILVKALELIARAQARAMQQFSLPVLIFMDEPALMAYGQSTYVSLSRPDIVQSFEQVVHALQAEGASSGVHCCSGVDWSILFELPLDVVNFDAYDFFDSMLVYTEELTRFLERGGCLSWGLVPTSEAVEKEEVDSLLRRFENGVERLTRRGVPEDLLRRQLLLTPSCGAGTLSAAQTEKVYRLTCQLQEALAEGR